MPRILSLNPQSSGSRTMLFGLALLFGLAVGAYLGWKLFMVPEEPMRETSAQSVAPPGPTAMAVQATGTPATRLAGAVAVGEIPPNFELFDLDGEPHALSQHRGQAVILNFWTTWCPPCRFEMPALQEVYDRYADQGFTILAINLTESDDEELIEPFREELGLTFPILLDRNSEVSGSLYQVLGLPTSIFIDRRGIVQEIYIGAIPLEDLESKVQSIMSEGS